MNLSGVIEYRYADSHGAGHGLADIIGEAAFTYMTSLSHCCGTHRGECAAELVVIGIVFQQLLVASRGKPGRQYMRGSAHAQRQAIAHQLCIALQCLTGACLDTHRAQSPPNEQTPDAELATMGAEGTASDLLNVQSAFDLAADTYAIDAKPILATIDAAFHPTDCGEIIQQTIR